MEKSADAFRTISEVADELRLPQHVLRFWESRFPQIRPLKRAGGRRYYRPADTVLLRTIRQLLYEDGYTIKGVQRLLKEQGVKRLSSEGLSFGAAASPAEPSPDVGDDAPWPAAGPAPVPGPDLARPPAAVRPPDGDTLREALAIVEACLVILEGVR